MMAQPTMTSDLSLLNCSIKFSSYLFYEIPHTHTFINPVSARLRQVRREISLQIVFWFLRYFYSSLPVVVTVACGGYFLKDSKPIISWTDQALPEAQTLSVGQGRPPAGRGGPVGRGASCRSPFDHQHLTAGLVLV